MILTGEIGITPRATCFTVILSTTSHGLYWNVVCERSKEERDYLKDLAVCGEISRQISHKSCAKLRTRSVNFAT